MANVILRNFKLNKGQPFSGGVDVTDANGDAVDITGATIDLVSQYLGGVEETDGTTGLWMRAAVNASNDGIDFSLTAAQTDALEEGIYTHFCNITYSGTTEKVAEFTIEYVDEDKATLPINRDNVLTICGLKLSDIDESQLDLAVENAIAVAQVTIPSKAYQWCEEHGYPRHVAVLAEMYAAEKLKMMNYPDKVDDFREEMQGIKEMLRNVSIDKDGDRIEDDSAGGSIDLILGS